MTVPDSLPPGLPPPIPRFGAVGRYAPSPTGDLHLGNLRTALAAWQDARDRAGVFLMRIEDLDAPRNVAGSEERILNDLRWLGVDWDEGPDLPDRGGPAGPYRQSERLQLYEAALRRAAAAGLVYGCSCSRKDLKEASAPHGPDGAVYAGTCREKGLGVGADYALRFRVDLDPVIEFDDLELGPQRFDLEEMSGDFVVRRRDGLFAYQLACAVDDALMGVTRVVRGADLLASTPRQIAILRALGLPVPRYRHIPLVRDEEGRRMSKRDGSLSLGSLRTSGATPAEARRLILEAPLLE